MLLMAGCAGVKQPAGSQTQATRVGAAAPPSAPPEPASKSEQVAGASARPAVATPAAPLAAPAPSPVQAPAKPAAPEAKAPAKAASTSAPQAQPPVKAAPVSAAAKPQAPPPLDLKSLETRLKDTKAIGVLTKLSLKNQVDDLLAQFRAFYQGKLKITLAELRRPFDLLLLKVLSLLQDSDPTLAAAIVASREAIWGILADRAKFTSFDGG
jgi:hypothetical protein